MPVIKTEQLTHVYAPGTHFEVTALENVSINIEKGDFYALVGATGSGKSTLIQHFNGLLTPTSGKLQVCGIDVTGKQIGHSLWRKVGLVFQQPEHQLFEETVTADISFGPRNLGLPADQVDERVIDAMKLVDLEPDKIGHMSPLSLSGGLRRKVALAGVLAIQPEVLVLDEPAAGLDPVSRNQLFERIDRLRSLKDMTVVLVTHNMEEVARWSNRMAVLHKGRLVMNGNPREIFSQQVPLKSYGLDVPSAVKMMLMLRSNGLAVSSDVLTVDEAVEEIIMALPGSVKPL
ncbi:MAG: energy-coupling factor transporter ATPase [Peptococcaceae bacterium]|nr:energy-coupling factor transporter ATPase [Peptococcaceae bacterium]